MKRKKTKTDGGRGRIRCGPLDSKTPPRTVSWIFTKQESRKKCRSQNKKHGGHNRVASSVWPRLVTVPLSRFFRLRTQWTSCLLWIMTLSGPQCWNMLTIILAKALPLSKLSVFVMLILHDSSSLSSSRRSVCLFFFVVIARSAWFWAMTPCLIRFCFLDLYFGLSFSQPIKKVAKIGWSMRIRRRSFICYILFVSSTWRRKNIFICLISLWDSFHLSCLIKIRYAFIFFFQQPVWNSIDLLSYIVYVRLYLKNFKGIRLFIPEFCFVGDAFIFNFNESFEQYFIN